MNTTSQFTSNFWNIYIAVIIIASLIGLLWLGLSQDKIKAPVKNKDGEVETMGHAWDGIEEYNNPLPRWWFYLYILTIVFTVGYLVAFPGLGDYKGYFGWTSVGQYEEEVAAANKEYGALYAQYGQMPIEELAQNDEAMRSAKSMFDTYCIQCHGSDAGGSRGFPSLKDHDWLWGGAPTEIQESIANGRMGVMAAWGPALGQERVKDVTHYVMSLSGRETADPERVKRGEVLFNGGPANCFTCHGADGKGIKGLGPNLTDDIWLWGGSEKAIIDTITNGRNNQMPAWSNFLDKDKLHLMTAYVWGLSNKDGAPAPTEASAVSASAASTPAASAPAADQADVVLENQAGNPVGIFYFATGKSDVAVNADSVVAELVSAGKAGKKLVISGYTDSTGNAQLNAELSKKRAEAVRAFLVAQGVSEANIELRKPEDTTAAQGNSAQGRRVEVKVEG